MQGEIRIRTIIYTIGKPTSTFQRLILQKNVRMMAENGKRGGAVGGLGGRVTAFRLSVACVLVAGCLFGGSGWGDAMKYCLAG